MCRATRTPRWGSMPRLELHQRLAVTTVAVVGLLLTSSCSSRDREHPAAATVTPTLFGGQSSASVPASPSAPGPPTGQSPTRPPVAVGSTPTNSKPTATSAARASSSSPPGACRTAQLRASLGAANGAAGTALLPLRFTNKSAQPCRLSGFPGVSLVDAAGHLVGRPANRAGGQAADVELLPGHVAIAQLQIGDFGDTCLQGVGLRIYPPQQTAALFVRAPLQVCRGAFEVQPLHAA